MIRWFLFVAVFVLAACARPAPPPSIDPLAERYVKLALEIGAHEDGYIDAYQGPPEWRTAAEAAPRDTTALGAEADDLLASLRAIDKDDAPPIDAKRIAFLEGHLVAAAARLRMIEGERFSFADEAEALFGVRPEIKPLESYQPVLDEIAALVPGAAPLHERVAAYRKQFEIPADRLEAVMQAAIAECRRRTLAHITLAENERFELSLVSDKPWSGYNWFQGDARSKIEINTDVPSTIDRAIDLGCHEGYPGHHTHHTLMEKLYTERGWVEHAVRPLFAPSGFIAEGTANLGIELAFPGDEKVAFEKAALYPMAGLNAAEAERFDALNRALQKLRSVEYTVADDYLAGRIDGAEAARRLEIWQLQSPERANKRVAFIDAYRSYIINYGLGLDQARARLDAAGDDETARWALMERLLAEPTSPADLKIP
jgi:hypothetical protein